MTTKPAARSYGPRALLLGSTGYVGSRILSVSAARYIPLRVSRITNEYDLIRFEQEVQKALEIYPDAALVNCLGIRSSSRENMELINVGVLESLIKVLETSQTQLIHLGSAAEIAEVIHEADLTTSTVSPHSLTYKETKSRGTEIALTYKNALVLRLYNLNGLPHQPDSGLHQLCLRIRSSLNNDPLEVIVDATRDYVEWRKVPVILDRVMRSKMTGLLELCSGFGTSISDIVHELPNDIRDEMSGLLVAPDYFSPVIGIRKVIDPSIISSQEIAKKLSREVLSCAFS